MSYQLYATKPETEASTDPDKLHALTEPILASFPERMPAPKELRKMKFTISEQDQSKKTMKKRVIKSHYKNVKYLAKNFGSEVSDRNQARDYYIGVMKNDGKVYMVPVSTAYQFSQEIDGFKEKYGQIEDNVAF